MLSCKMSSHGITLSIFSNKPSWPTETGTKKLRTLFNRMLVYVTLKFSASG